MLFPKCVLWIDNALFRRVTYSFKAVREARHLLFESYVHFIFHPMSDKVRSSGQAGVELSIQAR